MDKYNERLLVNIPNDERKRKCPFPECEESFHLWEEDKLYKHLKERHRGFLIENLRSNGLYAEASAIDFLS